MVTTWIGYCLLTSALLGMGAFAAERALGHYRKPVRWVWLAAIVGSVALPTAAFLAPDLFSPATGGDVLAPAVLAFDGAAKVVDGPVAAAAPLVNLEMLSTALGWLWGLSVLFIAVHLMRTQRRLRREMKQWTPGDVLDSPVLVSENRGPAVVGIRRTCIVMPRWIAELEEEMLRLVFLHEREHQKAGDQRLFALGVAALVLMPWNPVLWWQVARLRLAIEFDCDRRVLELGIPARDYAEALLAVGSRVSEPLLAAAAFAERKPSVERRLRRMTEPVSRLRGPRTFGAAGVAALAIVLVLGAPPPAGVVSKVQPAAAPETPADATTWTPAPRPSVDNQSDRPAFIPYDTPPMLQNGPEVTEVLGEAYPADMKEAGLGGRVEVWLYVDEEGAVANQVVKTSSGNDRLDEAAIEVAKAMRFTPARNRDAPTPVWVSQFFTFLPPDASKAAEIEARREAEKSPDQSAAGADAPALRPLIVIDGVVQPASLDMSELDPSGIESVEVLKGEAAFDRYGDRAQNGVVEITTKSGGGL